MIRDKERNKLKSFRESKELKRREVPSHKHSKSDIGDLLELEERINNIISKITDNKEVKHQCSCSSNSKKLLEEVKKYVKIQIDLVKEKVTNDINSKLGAVSKTAPNLGDSSKCEKIPIFYQEDEPVLEEGSYFIWINGKNQVFFVYQDKDRHARIEFKPVKKKILGIF
jgi:hypothetical protein